MHDWVDRPILKVMTDEGLPFQILATQAVDAVIAATSDASLAALANEGDLRSSTIAAVELLLIDFDKPLTADAREAIASMVFDPRGAVAIFHRIAGVGVANGALDRRRTNETT